jgi:hypothetical protein
MAGLDRNAVQVGSNVTPETLTPATWSMADFDDGSRDNLPADPTFCVAVKGDGTPCAARRITDSELCAGHTRAYKAALKAN